jgi:hypothetical protein
MGVDRAKSAYALSRGHAANSNRRRLELSAGVRTDAKRIVIWLSPSSRVGGALCYSLEHVRFGLLERLLRCTTNTLLASIILQHFPQENSNPSTYCLSKPSPPGRVPTPTDFGCLMVQLEWDKATTADL